MKRKETIWKWIKLFVLGLMSVFMLVITAGFAWFAWIKSGVSVSDAFVEPRALEQLEEFYGYALFAVVSAALLSLTVIGLLRIIWPGRQPGKLTMLLQRRGLQLTSVFVGLFAVSFVLELRSLHTIAVIRHYSELYPAGEVDRSGELSLAAACFFFAAIVSLVSGLKGKKKKQQKETGSPK